MPNKCGSWLSHYGLVAKMVCDDYLKRGRALRIAIGIMALVLVMAGGAGATKFIRNDATGGDCTSSGIM
jgi:hypothetical protein